MEKRRGRREIEVARRIKGLGESKGERQIRPVISFLSVLHSLKHSETFTELHTEEKREEEDRDDQEEKRGSQKERDQSSL